MKFVIHVKASARVHNIYSKKQTLNEIDNLDKANAICRRADSIQQIFGRWKQNAYQFTDIIPAIEIRFYSIANAE